MHTDHETMAEKKLIPIHAKILSPAGPKFAVIRSRRDYPDVSGAYLDIAETFASPLLFGPPLCDELIALVLHMFTAEEAEICRHIGIGTGKNASQLAALSHLPPETVAPALQRLALEKRVIFSYAPGHGRAADRKYRMLALLPGVFELCMARSAPDALTDWHCRFAALFEALFATGYIAEYQTDKRIPFIRYVPVRQSIAAHPMALPSDKMEMILDRYKIFGVGICQCRTSEEIVGRGCGKPKQNCAVMGDFAAVGIRDGWLKKVSKKEMLAIKLEAEREGLVNWTINIEDARSQGSCSCCACCCQPFRMIAATNAPGIVAPPHFRPACHPDRCSGCGRCAAKCPVQAITVDKNAKTRQYAAERCIGCGLCAVACPRRALTMEVVPDYQPPYTNWLSMALDIGPGIVKNMWKIWKTRRSLF